MSFTHTKNTVVLIGAADPASTDVTAYAYDSALDTKLKEHEVTVYGQSDEDYDPGLRANTFKLKLRRNAALDAILAPFTGGNMGTLLYVIRRPAGTGSGLAQEKFSCFVTNDPRNNPLNAIEMRELDCRIKGTVDYTAQT